MAGLSVCIDLSRWMSYLPQSLKNLPFIYLAIPGSNNSMTFGINEENIEVSPDAPDFLKELQLKECQLSYKLKDIVPWMRTQEANITQQLFNGVRYFDLRLSYKEDSDDLFFVHNFYAGEVKEQFELIKQFLDKHEEEIVILDCQHFYFDRDSDEDFEKRNHKKMIKILTDIFGSLICPPQENFEQFTLNYLHSKKYQVIVVYRYEKYARKGFFWSGCDFLTECPDKKTHLSLKDYLQGLVRPLVRGFVTPAVLTPNFPIIIKYLRESNIKEFSAIPVAENILPCIYNTTPILPTQVQSTKDKMMRLNVVIADFVNMFDYEFPLKIVNLNKKLYKDLTVKTKCDKMREKWRCQQLKAQASYIR